MKKILAILLITVGTGSYADGMQKCKELTELLFFGALGGAPIEVQQDRVNGYKRDIKLPATVAGLNLTMLGYVHQEIGKDKIYNRKTDIKTLERIQANTCSEFFVAFFWN